VKQIQEHTNILKHRSFGIAVQTNYSYDNTSQLYDYVYAFFYGFVQSINYTYDEKTIKIDELSSFTEYTYDASGSADQFIQYMPYGELLVDQRSSGHDIRFPIAIWITGKERDEETGLDYFGARYYDSDISVWLSVDPLSDMWAQIEYFPKKCIESL